MNNIGEKKYLLDNYNSEFSYNEDKSNLKISFERIAFIFKIDDFLPFSFAFFWNNRR